MNKYNTFLIILLLLTSSTFMRGQSMKAFLVAAEESFEKKDFGSALKYYLSANEFNEDRYDLVYKSAESARMFNAYNLAEARYQTIIDKEADNNYPLVTFWLADIKQRLGKYTEAIDMYKIYLTERGDEDEYFTKKANKEVEACAWAIGLMENPSESLEINHMEGDVNTPYSDFAGMENENMFYYSTMRFKKNKDSHNPPRFISKILKEEDGTSTIADTIFDDNVFFNAHLTYNKDKTKAYFTICDYKEVAEIRCDLYSTAISTDGSFGTPKKLPDFINDVNATNTQPNMAYNSILNKEILYFVSDREGGKGMRDIWYTIMDHNGNFTLPMNLSSVNTSEDDITPFFYSPSNSLYFSSTGYMKMGGFDIYAVPFEDTDFGEVVHQGYPLNSSYDDIYYWLSNDGETAYFSSNREGALFLDPMTEACCYDIFKIEVQPIEVDLQVLTFNKKTLTDLPSAKVRLYNTNTNELIGEKMNVGLNESHFKLFSGKNYYIIASRLGYFPDTTRFNTLGVQKSGTITKKLYLEPQDLALKILTFDKTTLIDLSGVKLTLENLTDNTTENIVITQKLDNEFKFNILRGHNYRVTANRDGYQSVSSLINTNDFTGTEIIKKLYLPDLLNAYLPLVLYFDNDRPDRRTRNTFTKKTYSSTYENYMLREKSFIQKYTLDLTDEGQITEATNEIEDFFEYDVKGGRQKLELFMSTLYAVLQNGHTVAIQLKGFASPRADYKYNLILAQRRVNSLDNEIRKYMDGGLVPFIKSGKLSITDVSYGESLSPDGISDSIKDEKHSIYSVRASKERRVEAIKISTDLNEK